MLKARKQHKESFFTCCILGGAYGRPLSLNTGIIISPRTGYVKHSLSGNDLFCGATPDGTSPRLVTLRLAHDLGAAFALLGHAPHPPLRHTAPRSAGNAAGLRPACFPACAAHCAAAHDGSALPVTLRALLDGQLLVPPQKTPCACGATAFSPAGLAVSLLPGAPRFCVGAALVAARGRVWAPSLHFLPSHMAAAPLAPTPHATQGADIHSIHRA